MLTHWGDAVFCLWAVLLSARALFLFLSDGFVRYAVNEFNLGFHRDASAANNILGDHFGFLNVSNLFIAVLVFVLLQFLPQSGAALFDIPLHRITDYSLPLLVGVYLTACGLQNGQRLLAATQEARGKVRINLQFESLLTLTEIVVLSLAIAYGAGFAAFVWIDSGIIAGACLLYQSYLFLHYPLQSSFSIAALKRGAQAFVRAGRLYLGNFFEKLSTDGLVLLLSLFRFPKVSIAVFAAMRTMVNAPLLAQNLLLNSYTPRLQQLFAQKDEVALTRLLQLARLFLGTVLLGGMLLCVPLYQPVFLRWTHGSLPFDPAFLTGMLLWCVAGIYGNGYLFVLKGLNLLREFWLLMALRCLLLLFGFFWAGAHTDRLLWVLCSVELLVSGIVLPAVLHRFWLQQGFRGRRSTDLLYLSIHLTAAFLLYFFLY